MIASLKPRSERNVEKGKEDSGNEFTKEELIIVTTGMMIMIYKERFAETLPIVLGG